jgi:hypothetical protein
MTYHLKGKAIAANLASYSTSGYNRLEERKVI